MEVLMTTKHYVLLAAIMSFSSSAAHAAEPALVSKIGGKNVVWQHGDQEAAPGIQTLLSPGDRVTVGKGSFVEVEYLSDNCSIRAKEGGSIVISDVSPCSASANKKASSEGASGNAASADAKVRPTSAGAVEVTDKKGPVARVNKGNGLIDASVGDSLKDGDEVFAGPHSSVTLYFAASQCSYTVPASSVFKVTSKAPCKAPVVAQNGGAGAAATAGVAPGVLLGAGALVVGGAAAVVIITNDGSNNNSTPATPD